MKDFHIHTVYSDGSNTPEEMVIAAINMGLTAIGFSDHSYTEFDTCYCMKKEKITDYVNEISALKEKYKDKIQILCGIEQDIYSDMPTDMYDYVIGSVHYLKLKNEYVPVDENAEILKKAADKYFDGDIYGIINEYYMTVSNVVNKTKADIIGHFDLISKFNENKKLFNENDARYVNLWKYACDCLIDSGAVFEINTGAIYRGYKTEVYPSAEIQTYIRERGGKFIYSSDSHCTEAICYKF